MDLIDFFRGLIPGESKKKRGPKAKRSTAGRPKLVRSSDLGPGASSSGPRSPGSADSSDPSQATTKGRTGAETAAGKGDEEREPSRRKSGVFKVAKEKPGGRPDGKIAAQLRPLIEQADVSGLKARLDDVVRIAAQLRDRGRQNTSYLAAAFGQLQQATSAANYQAAALTTATMTVESAFLGDPILKKAQEVLSISPFIEKATKAKKVGDALGLAADLDRLSDELDALLKERTEVLSRIGDSLLKTLAGKDFLGLAALAEAIARDAALVGSTMDSNSVDETADEQALTAQAAQEKWVVIDKQVLQLNQSLLTGQYQFAVELAKMVFTGAGVMGDPAMAKAVELTKGCRQIRDAFRAQNVAMVERLCTTLAKQASMFNSPLMARANQLTDQVAQWQTANEAQEFTRAMQLASSMARTSALLIDPTVRRASLLAGDVPKVEVCIKRRDYSGALATLDAALK